MRGAWRGTGLLVLSWACGSPSPASSVDGGGGGGGTHDGGARHDSSGGGAMDAVDHAPRCATGEALCGHGCIDVTADDQNCGGCGVTCSGPRHCASGRCQASKIEHVVLIVEENHTFDSYFGAYCQAAAGSNPTCTTGTACCEGAPSVEPHGASPLVLDDDPNNPASNFATDRDHAEVCELQEIDDGKMDGYVTGSTGADKCVGVGPECASANNWAVAGASTVGAYWTLASDNALADRYFQPAVGSSSSNDMYLAIAHYQFMDDADFPDTVGSGCVSSPCGSSKTVSFDGRTTIADLLLGAGKTFAVYADGFADAKAAAPSCASPPSSCRYASCTDDPIACHACLYDPSDIPFAYYSQLGDSHTRDDSALASDLASGSLPSFAFVKAASWHNEHPNVSTISDGVEFVTTAIGLVESSPYASSTLILLTWDEGGGFFDHVSPPAPVDVDESGKPLPYGTRVPFLAIGPFARKGRVSHVVMEHSSVVRFLEYNFLGPVGQLGYNDAKVHNLGSLLDPAATGVVIPE